MFPNATNRFNGTCSYSRKAIKPGCFTLYDPHGRAGARLTTGHFSLFTESRLRFIQRGSFRRWRPGSRQQPETELQTGRTKPDPVIGSSSFQDRSGIETAQIARLRALLGELSGANRFYGPKLRQAGLSAEVPTLDAFRSSMPFTEKAELVEDQRRHPPYGSNLTYSLDRYSRFSRTSATTGKPMHWLDTPEGWQWMLDNWDRVFEAAGVSSRDRLFFAFSFGPFLGFWTAFEAAARRGCLCIPGGGMSSLARLEAILENIVTVLCCTPTYALRLGEVAAEQRIDLSRGSVRTILVAGEPGGSIGATVSTIERLWPKARVVDHHGMTETGPVSYGCPREPHRLHVMESAYIAEVIDPGDHRPVAPGDIGELVLTTLGRTGSPLLRYRTGDLVRPARPLPCACGSWELGLEGGILGRSDDMVVVRGVNLYPGAVEAVIRGCREVVEYRVEVDHRGTLCELSVQAEAASESVGGPELGRRLETDLRSAFGLRIPVSMVPQGTLPRPEFKANRWVRM